MFDRIRQSRAATIATLAMLVCFAGCDDDDSPGVVIAPQGCLEFVAASSPAPGTVVARPVAGSSCDFVAVELIVSDVTDLFGADLIVNFDPTVVTLSGSGTSPAGSILGTGLIFDLASAGSGQVAIGVSRTSPPGVTVTGPQLLVTLAFTRVADQASSSTLNFTNPSLLDSSPQPMEIPGITWSGGTFVVTEL